MITKNSEHDSGPIALKALTEVFGVDGKESIFVAPQMIYIKAEKMHELTALEDNTVAYCIHTLRDGNGVEDILDPTMIPEGIAGSTIAKSLIAR